MWDHRDVVTITILRSDLTRGVSNTHQSNCLKAKTKEGGHQPPISLCRMRSLFSSHRIESFFNITKQNYMIKTYENNPDLWALFGNTPPVLFPTYLWQMLYTNIKTPSPRTNDRVNISCNKEHLLSGTRRYLIFKSSALASTCMTTRPTLNEGML